MITAVNKMNIEMLSCSFYEKSNAGSIGPRLISPLSICSKFWGLLKTFNIISANGENIIRCQITNLNYSISLLIQVYLFNFVITLQRWLAMFDYPMAWYAEMKNFNYFESKSFVFLGKLEKQIQRQRELRQKSNFRNLFRSAV